MQPVERVGPSSATDRVPVAVVPYRVLQQRCKAAGLPANKTAAVLRQLLVEHEATLVATPSVGFVACHAADYSVEKVRLPHSSLPTHA
jgi:hypothetical protein